MPKLNNLINNFKPKTQEITEQIKGLQFSTIVLRNKLTQHHTNTITLIITQVTAVNITTQQMMVISPLAQSCWQEICPQGDEFIHQDVKLWNSGKYNIFTPWIVSLHT